MRLAIIFTLMLSAFALPAAPERRTLLISAPSPDNDSYQKQAALLLPAWSGLVERDFVVQTKFGAKDFSVVLIGKDGGENFGAPRCFQSPNSSPSSMRCPCAAPKCANAIRHRRIPPFLAFMPRTRRPFVFLAALLCCAGLARAAAPVDFAREVLPILSDACYKCHGPDEKSRKAKLRLDLKEGLYRTRDDVAVVEPGARPTANFSCASSAPTKKR